LGADRGQGKRSLTGEPGEPGEPGELGDRKVAHRNRDPRAGLERKWMRRDLRLLLEWVGFGRGCRRTSWVNEGSCRERGWGPTKRKRGRKTRILTIMKVAKREASPLRLLFTSSVIIGVAWIPRKRIAPTSSILGRFVSLIANDVTIVDCTPSTPTSLNNAQ